MRRSWAHGKASDSAETSAKRLRHAMSEEERLLWVELKAFRRSGYAFRRQAAVGPFVADFLCRKARLIVEVDGLYHDRPEQMERDARRTAWLEAEGYRVMRYAAREVWSDMDGVVSGIEQAVIERTEG